MTTHHDHEHDSDGMFPRWPVTFDPPARRIVDPPQPVIVSINAALSVTSSTSLRDGIPLRVRAEGLAMDMKVQGALHGWARTNVGSWLAYVSFTIPTGNGMGQLDVRQWCPSDAITPLQ